MEKLETQDLELLMTEQEKYQFDLINGDFECEEASNILLNLIDEKINFQKKLRLQKWEKNHDYDLNATDKRIEELESQKNKLIQFFNQKKELANQVKIKSIVEITIGNE